MVFKADSHQLGRVSRPCNHRLRQNIQIERAARESPVAIPERLDISVRHRAGNPTYLNARAAEDFGSRVLGVFQFVLSHLL